MFDWRCAPAEETFADEPLDGLLGHALLVDALRLPKERWDRRRPAEAQVTRGTIARLRSCLRKDWSPRDSPRSIASAK